MFVVSPINKSSLALDLSIAMLPTVMWAVYLFGVRAAVLMILCGLCCAVPDFCVQKFLFRRSTGESLSPFAFLAGVMAMFWRGRSTYILALGYSRHRYLPPV